jgi:hypothetical protein
MTPRVVASKIEGPSMVWVCAKEEEEEEEEEGHTV